MEYGENETAQWLALEEEVYQLVEKFASDDYKFDEQTTQDYMSIIHEYCKMKENQANRLFWQAFWDFDTDPSRKLHMLVEPVWTWLETGVTP